MQTKIILYAQMPYHDSIVAAWFICVRQGRFSMRVILFCTRKRFLMIKQKCTLKCLYPNHITAQFQHGDLHNKIVQQIFNAHDFVLYKKELID